MTSAPRKFSMVVTQIWLAIATIAIAWPAAGQTNLNRFDPRLPATSSDEGYEEEEVEEYEPAPPARRSGYQRSPRAKRPQATPQQPQQRYESEETPASYQSSAARYQNPGYRPQGTGASRTAMSDQRSFSGSVEEQEIPRTASRPVNRQYDNRGGSTSGSRSRGRGMYENSAISRQPTANENYVEADADYDAVENESCESSPASYQSSAGNYRTANRGMTGYGQSNNSYGRKNNYGRSPNPMSFGGTNGLNLGGLFGPLAARTSMNGTTSSVAAPIVKPEPIVTPDAVYLDAEPITVGKPAGPNFSLPRMPGGGTPEFQGPLVIDGQPMTEGRSFLPGGPIMGRTYDGYTNPQCNNCCGNNGCGGNCGGGCCENGCGGPRCGNNYGMYGGCEEGYDCCGGCGPNYGLFDGPYGRPWILAPIDWLFGGLWHCGPRGGACDPCGNWWWGQDFTVFGGVHDFRSPVNITGNSNFGFHEGVNWAMPLWQEYGIGAQVGFQATQSNLQSSTIDVFDDYRKQTFVTAGLFQRPCDGRGLQYGVVFDYLHDEYYQQFDVGQLRGELSWLWDCRNELGFWFAAGVMDSTQHDDVFLGADEYSPINQYAFFYRRRFCRGGEGRLWGGFTGNSGGLIGADFRLPIAQCWAVETGFNYIINESQQNDIFRDETWNVGMNLVWYWGCNANCRSLYRPLFNVADNGSFMVTRSGLIVP
jgi:hypothetical protein